MTAGVSITAAACHSIRKQYLEGLPLTDIELLFQPVKAKPEVSCMLRGQLSIKENYEEMEWE